MLLTEQKTYTMTVTEVDQSPKSGLNKKDVIVEYTNLELLHAVLTCSMPAGRISSGYRGKRKNELLGRISMVESALKVRGDQLVKSEQTMYLDVSERGAISHYLGMIYTKLIAKKLYGMDCMAHINLLEQPQAEKFVKYNGAYRQDLIGYQMESGTWSIYDPIGRSENSQAAFENGCRQASMITSVNGGTPKRKAACMTYYERGYLTAVLGEYRGEDGFPLTFPESSYFKACYQPLYELFADECPERLYGETKASYELDLALPWFDEKREGFRHLYLGIENDVMEQMKAGHYEEIPKVLEKKAAGETKRQKEDGFYSGSDGITVGTGLLRKA